MESFLLNKEIYEVPEKQFRATLDELTELLTLANSSIFCPKIILASA